MEEGRSVRLLPIAANDVPRYDEANGKLLVPEGDFLLYKGAHDKTMILLNSWMDNREHAEGELCRIANELDKWEQGCNISSLVSGVAGVGGGAAVISGVILMPPVAVAGLAVGGVAAASSMTTGILKLRNIKKNLVTAKDMLEYDQKLTETLANSIATLEEAKSSILSSNKMDVAGRCATRSVNREALASGGKVGTVSLAGGAVRLLLKESASVSSAVAKGAVHAITAVGIAIDIVTVALSVKGLIGGSRSETAGKLREAAEELKTTRETITRHFLMDYLL